MLKRVLGHLGPKNLLRLHLREQKLLILRLDLHKLLLYQLVLLSSVRSLLRCHDLDIAPIRVPFNELRLSLCNWLSSRPHIRLNLVLLDGSQTENLLLSHLRLSMLATHWLSVVHYPILMQNLVLTWHSWRNVLDLTHDLLAVTCKLDRGLVYWIWLFKLMLASI